MKSIIDDWNKSAQAYEKFNNSADSYSYCIELPAIREMLPDIRGRSVLDLGCGTGIFTFLLEEYHPKNIVGIDVSEEMLALARKKAREKHSDAIFVLGDALKAPDLIDESVDFLFSSTMSHYMEDLTGLFETISRCLKKDGKALLSVIHPVYSAMYPIANGDRFRRMKSG